MNQKLPILVVEDEKDVKDLMLLHLKRENYEALGVENGEEALKLIQENQYNLVVLDWMLPGISGLEICKKIDHKFPVLMVTARADTADIVLGLEMGADDYITKPFEISVFLARVRALMRRAYPQDKNEEGEKIHVGNLTVHLEAHKVSCGTEEIPLTPSEFKLLAALMKHRGKVLSREKLIELVQGQGVVVVDRAIDTHVFGLRKKLGPCADVIETIRGVGYRVEI
jgi:two-component system, OmpR family, phosphate regulon response regulator PhoB